MYVMYTYHDCWDLFSIGIISAYISGYVCGVCMPMQSEQLEMVEMLLGWFISLKALPPVSMKYTVQSESLVTNISKDEAVGFNTAKLKFFKCISVSM